MAKIKLLLEEKDLKTENYVMGIVASSSHLKFVHNLNKTGLFNFERNDDHSYIGPDEDEFFICFSFDDTENETHFKLIKNKGTSGMMGKELRGMDYILLIQSEDENIFQSVKETLNSLKFIEAVALIPYNKLSERTRKILPL